MNSRQANNRHRLLTLLATSAALAAAAPGTAQADVTCDRVAAATGSDAASGTSEAPFRTAQKLADSLSPGMVGCLRAGTYQEAVRVSRGGTSSAPVTIRSYPGERARLVGRLWIAQGANYVKVSDLDLDGRNSQRLPSPTVNADNVTFSGNEVTNGNTGICFVLGSPGYGDAANTLITGNRIHHCGQLPAANHDHGIYVEQARDAKIYDNVIYANADRGIQLYPDAQRTHIRGNIIDGNGQGVIFSGEGGVTSNDNVVEGNLITNSKLRYNVESWYPDGTPIGRGNIVRGNCIKGGARDSGNGGIQTPAVGFSLSGNIIQDPLYVDRASGDYRLRAGSPCAALLSATAPTTDPTSPSTDPVPSTEEPAPEPKVTTPRKPARRGSKHPLTVLALNRPSSRPVVVQVVVDGRWRTVARRDYGTRFRVHVTVGRRLGRVLRARAVVPGKARSAVLRIPVYRR